MLAKQFSHAELSIISSVIRYEIESRHELPKSAFYKSIALDACNRLKISWERMKELFNV